MRAEVTELEGLSRRLTVVLPKDEVEKAFQERLQEVAKKINLHGFRPGKAPLSVIKNRIGKTLLREIASELMQSSFQQTIADRKLKIAGAPEVKPGEIATGQDLSYEVVYEAYPEFELAEFAGTAVERITAVVADPDVDAQLLKIAKQSAEWHPVDRAAVVGDRVVIDFEGFIDNQLFAGGSAKNYTVELGDKQMLAGFEEQLAGKQAGEPCVITVQFPDDYATIHLAGKTATFNVTVHQVLAADAPVVDDALAVKCGIAEGGLATLKERVKRDMQSALDQTLEAWTKQNVLDLFMQQNSIIPPQSMVKDEIGHLQQLSRQRLSMQYPDAKRDWSKLELPDDPYIKQAEKRVVLGLLVSAAIQKFGVKLDRDRVNQRLTEMSKAHPHPEQAEAYLRREKRVMTDIEAAVLEDQVVSELLNQATVADKSLSYQAAMDQFEQIVKDRELQYTAVNVKKS